MSAEKSAVMSIVLGFIIGFVGVYFIGLLSAITISKGFFQWFEENLSLEISFMLIHIVQGFIGFSILGLFAGYLIGRYSLQTWKKNVLLCYFAFIFYMTVGVSILYSVEVINPLSGQPYWALLPMLILPVCIWLASFLSKNSYDKSSLLAQ